MSPECLNWPPSRGPNPHDHRALFAPGKVIRKDLPAPPEPESAKAEKATISAFARGDKAMMAKLNIKVPTKARLKGLKSFSRSEPKPPLVGEWQTGYQVADIAALSLELAHSLLGACRMGGKFYPAGDDRHLDSWWGYAPRTLWVDITYPLARGVRLMVAPFVRTWSQCGACGAAKSARHHRAGEPTMSPGYLLWTVAKEYERIYKEHEKYGVWGHALSDLAFEMITVEKDGVVRLGIGS